MLTDVLMKRPEGFGAHALHLAVYATLAAQGSPRQFLYADLGNAVLARGEFSDEIAFLGKKVPSVEAQREYRFTLTAWPTVKNNGKARSIGVAGDKDSLRRRWLMNRAAVCGFEIMGKPFMATCNRVIEKPAGKFSINVTTYEGLLRVTDRGRFQQILSEGIGQGRAYGCGLLVIRPAGGGDAP